MFSGCTSLTEAPELPATTMHWICYAAMFYGCTSLTEAPELPATTLSYECYNDMFNGCTSLNSVTTHAATWHTDCANNWLSGVSPTGDFYNLGGANIPAGASGIPEGWTKHYPPVLTVTAVPNNPNYGTITGAGQYEGEATATLTATPNVNSAFVKWTEDNTTVSTDATYNFTVECNRNLVANFLGNSSVNGHIYDQDGTTILAGATVTIYGKDEFGDYKTYTTTSGNDGAYSMTVSVGTYKVKVELEGFKTVYSDYFTAAFAETTTVDMTLQENYNPVAEVIAEEINFASARASWTMSGESKGSRSLQYYTVYRRQTANGSGPIADSLQQQEVICGQITDTTFVDANWGNMENGTYQYGIQVTYGGNHNRGLSELTVCDGTTTNSYVPAYGWYADAYQRCQMVYTEDMLADMVGGEISSMKFYLGTSATSAWTGTWQIYMMDYPGTTISAFVDPSNATTVYEGTLDASGTEMLVIFNTPYKYEGGNLLIGFDEPTLGNYRSASFYGISSNGSSVQGISYESLGSITPTQRDFLPKVTFSYEAKPDSPVTPITWSNNLTKTLETDYLTLTAIEDNTSLGLEVNGSPNISTLQYSYDGLNWNNITETTTFNTLANGEVVKLRSKNAVSYYDAVYSEYNENYIIDDEYNENYIRITCSGGKFDASGNANTLIDYENADTIISLTDNKGCFFKLFRSNTGLVSAANMTLPAITLANFCYYGMFDGCNSLTETPELPATTLAGECYAFMFGGCKSLTETPELPAMTLAENCYNAMFAGGSLTEAPDLPATTLAESCYNNMFSWCTSLTKAPELPATTLAKKCYCAMFGACSSLTVVPLLPATTLAEDCYNNMFLWCQSLDSVSICITTWNCEHTEGWLNGVASIGNLYNFGGADIPTGTSGIPEGWTEHTTAPVTITVSPNNPDYGTVSGGGTFDYGTTATLTATPNIGYTFINWTENDVEVSTDAEYSFTVDNDKNLVANFNIQTFDITASANNSDYGNVSGAGSFVDGEICTLTATPNSGYTFVNWTENDEIVSTNATYNFTVNADRNLVANFNAVGTEKHWIPDQTLYADNMSVIGIIQINDEEQRTTNLEIGAFCGDEVRGSQRPQYISGSIDRYIFFLTVYGQASNQITFKLYDHSLGEELDLSSPAAIAFVANGTTGSVGNPHVMNFTSGQDRDLTSGWNWYSTYIDVSGASGLTMMENGLGTDAMQIKSQTAFVTYDYGMWYGALTAVNVEQMYMIQMNAAHTLNKSGSVANASAHPISISNGWKWIGYPVNQTMSIDAALANFTPHNGDYIKSQTGFSQYYEGIGWLGALSTLSPGNGYMYQNTSGSAKTLVYATPSKSDALGKNITPKGNHWEPDMYQYANNMSVVAAISVNGEIQNSDNIEVAAFCNGECRGSAKPMFIEQLDKYVVFLTVYGNENDEIAFRLYDAENNEELSGVADEIMTFAANGTIGSVSTPYTINFGFCGISEMADNSIEIYPNPANKNSEIQFGENCEKIEVFNSIGVKIAEYQNVSRIEGFATAGVYVIRVTNGEKSCNQKLIIK